MLQEYTDYPKLLGLSGANVGIPFNIISICKNNEITHMLNPIITKVSKQTHCVQSNCGSLCLSEKVPVIRREWIEVSYYDITGRHHQDKFTFADGGSTIQHEIEHNKGILIIDHNKHI